MDSSQDFFMRAGEGEVVELLGGQPATGNLGGWRDKLSAPGFECDAVTGDGMFDGAEWFHGGNAESQLFRSGVLRVVGARLSFGVREFPEVRVDDSGRALPDEEFTVALDNEGEEAAFGGGFAFAKVGELVLQIFFSRDAEFLDGAGSAIRRAWSADERAEFHEGLV